MEGGETVCVTGASGFIGSWLVMRLLERGYFVKATVRDPENVNKLKHLWELPKASTHLSLWRGELAEEGSFDDAIQGCSGVFHVATPMDFSPDRDLEAETIKPTVNGVLNIMRSCLKAKTIRRFIYTSTTGAVTVGPPPPPPEYDESFWTDIDFCYAEKMPGWAYFVAKTKAEKAAWEFAKENDLDLITIHPSVVVGPFLTPSKPFSIDLGMALITRNEALYSMLARVRAVHVDDVCSAHIFLFEHPQAKGRYICSSHTFTIVDLAKSLNQKYPQYNVPSKFEGIDESLKTIPCSSKKLMDLGFTFKYESSKYDSGDLYAEAFDFCKEKGFMPQP
ncbi:bifunctional dihydroflavonol 4-reductase/flavanone 4-reductase [Manihot esculenta]|uniref:NAD-dependent epimerase/dehydratase domain-containing protein n=1 Tax=Manihot esculenta TaxID=3983 RepID=A0A2C9VWM9_MANES|nr:bifunctional dihydroflavonol 4-reductase/flavanone 4-reductase [Manihot esculenta]OAY50698.1 hypothetical protein MANES_05G157000v8 [Manihot esculenta]